jgi:hypothetical protein
MWILCVIYFYVDLVNLDGAIDSAHKPEGGEEAHWASDEEEWVWDNEHVAHVQSHGHTPARVCMYA